jgi:ElaB/YqjD/DUF883 family membrane-anchored ribosome-binding protein
MPNSPDAHASGGGAKVRDIKGANSTLSHDAAAFREKLSTLEKDLRELTRISRALASDTMGVIKENAGEYYHEGLERAKNLEKTVETRIKQHPLQSLLIAIGLGFLVGMLLRRH